MAIGLVATMRMWPMLFWTTARCFEPKPLYTRKENAKLSGNIASAAASDTSILFIPKSLPFVLLLSFRFFLFYFLSYFSPRFWFYIHRFLIPGPSFSPRFYSRFWNSDFSNFISELNSVFRNFPRQSSRPLSGCIRSKPVWVFLWWVIEHTAYIKRLADTIVQTLRCKRSKR